MKISYLLTLSLVSAIVVGQQSHHVTAVSQSSINLTTSFNRDNVKDFTWTLKTKQDNYQIMKIQNGRLAENLNSRYNWSHHGTILVINNLTKSDSGQYTAEITMWNNSMKEEKFNFTVLDPVPTPKIENQVEKIKDQCFVTLNCSAPSNKESFSYTWKYRYGDSEYHTINETVNTIRRPLPPDHQETEFMCIVQNQADQKNVTAHIKYCSVMSNTTSINIGVVVMALSVVFVVLFLVWMFKYSKRSSNTSEQDNQKDGAKTEQNNMLEEEENYKNEIEENRDYQKEGQADEDENEMKEHRNQDEHQNEDNVAHHDPEIGNNKMWENDRYENKVKKHKEEDEHWNNSKNKEIQLQDTRKHRPWTLTEEENKVKNHKKEDEHRSKDENREIHLQGNHKLLAKVKYENEMKKHKEEDEHWNKSKNKEIPLQDTREWDDRVQKDEVEEQEKKEDKENDEGNPLLEETEFG